MAINGATLTGSTSASPTGPITVIANDGTDYVSGVKFAGAGTNRDTVTIGGLKFEISYNGGTGHVTLTASSGTVTQNANGTCSWSLGTDDGPDESTTVTATVESRPRRRQDVRKPLR